MSSKYHLTQGRHSFNWWRIAHTLNKASQLLFAQYEQVFREMIALNEEMEENGERFVEFDETIGLQLWYPAFMLMGSAIEAALKGILIGRNPDIVDDSGLPKSLTIHKLLKLAQDCQISLTSQEKDVLELLTAFVEWAGRYPIPKKIEGFLAVDRQIHLQQDFELAKAIFIKLNSSLIQLPAFVFPSMTADQAPD